MTLARLLTQPVTVLNRAAGGDEDEYGDEVVEEWDRYDTDAYLEQTDSIEVQVDRDTVISNWLLVLPAGSVIDGGDQVITTDGTYEVIGRPARPWNPRLRAEHHIEARLRLADTPAEVS